MDVDQVRTGAATVLGGIPGLNAYAYVPGSMTTPAAVVGPVTIEYGRAFTRDPDTLSFSVWIAVAHNSDKHAQQRVNEFMSSEGSRSVSAAFANDNTLDGAVSDCKVVRAEPIDLKVDGGVTYLAAEFQLTALG